MFRDDVLTSLSGNQLIGSLKSRLAMTTRILPLVTRLSLPREGKEAGHETKVSLCLYHFLLGGGGGGGGGIVYWW